MYGNVHLGSPIQLYMRLEGNTTVVVSTLSMLTQQITSSKIAHLNLHFGSFKEINYRKYFGTFHWPTLIIPSRNILHTKEPRYKDGQLQRDWSV